MEPHSRTDDNPSSRLVLESQLRESYGRVVYSHKTHEKCADILLNRRHTIKLIQIVLSALTTAGFVSIVFGYERIGVIAGGIISTTLLAINSYTKNYDLGELAQKHKQSASDLWMVREQYLSLLVDVAMGEKPIESLQKERDKLLKELYGAYAGAPSTTYEAYRKAQKALQTLGDMSFTEDELDGLLPVHLRRCQKGKP